MTSGDSLRQVAQLVDALESAGVGVENVTITEDGDDPLADLSVRLPDGAARLDELAVAPPAETPDSDSGGEGTRNNRSEATEPAPDETTGGSSEPESGADEHPTPDATPSAAADGGDEQGNDGSTALGASEQSNDERSAVADDSDEQNGPDESDTPDAVSCRVEGCDRTFESTHGMKIHAAKAHDREEATDTQPHRDPERLQAVYDREETFEEMQQALETDVTAQTVRRNMMKFGIHEPESNPVDGYAAAAAATEPDALDAADGDDGTPDQDGDDSGSEPDRTDGSGAEPPAEDPSESGAESRQRTPSGDDDPADTEDATGDPVDEGTATDDSEPADLETPTGDAGPADTEATGEDVETAAAEHAEDTVADGGPEESRSLGNVTLPDSMTLPEGVDLESLAAATRESRTLYEFTQSLDVDRPTAQELLATFDLLELVTGRLGNRTEGELPEDEVVHRILDAVDARSTGGGTGASAD